MENEIAFVYHYWNIKDFTSYYGYKETWNKKKYSPYDIFVEHPLGEKSTARHYCSSCCQKRWIEACKRGEIYGEIIAVFTGKNAGALAHEREHQMIINHKALYGQDTLYNRNDGYEHFSTAGTKCPHDEKWCKDHSKTLKEKYDCDDWHEFWSKKFTEMGNRPEMREKRRQNALGEKNGMYGVHRYGKEAPMFGKVFINNGLSCKAVKREEVDGYLEDGWVFGKLAKVKKAKKWIHKGDIMLRPNIEDIDKYLEDGWEFGKAKKRA